MVTIKPLRAFRPTSALAPTVASVPYDVVDREEALELARDSKHSFLHVTKPEIDLPADTDPYSDYVYAKAAAALEAMIADGTLVQDPKPAFYIYALTMGQHTQTGLVLGASVAEYEKNIVRKHEFTRPDKENDRVRHIETTRAQTGKVFLVHKRTAALEREISAVRETRPHTSFRAADGVVHELWTVSVPERVATITAEFAKMDAIYIADGHHRSAAAARVAQAHRAAGTASPDTESFLAVSFPENEVRILPYNRVVQDLRGRSAEEFLVEVQKRFDVSPGKPVSSAARQIGMYLGGSVGGGTGAWWTLRTREVDLPSDPVARLDVSLLQDRLLAPLLGITDPRRDERIAFVGGIRGEDELVKRVHALEASVAFSMHPTSIGDLFAIADNEQVMPPKSTWFEPKLRDGLVVHRF
ncbi:MAG: DUF1015 domain-containing protein [Clostridia bacterium]|nr:DUF1015 domain-containing protein [Deltaproteobacteria bacterium]